MLHLRIHPQGLWRGSVHALQIQAEAPESAGTCFGDWEMDLIVGAGNTTGNGSEFLADRILADRIFSGQ